MVARVSDSIFPIEYSAFVADDRHTLLLSQSIAAYYVGFEPE